jgi:hypothetical protein
MSYRVRTILCALAYRHADITYCPPLLDFVPLLFQYMTDAEAFLFVCLVSFPHRFFCCFLVGFRSESRSFSVSQAYTVLQRSKKDQWYFTITSKSAFFSCLVFACLTLFFHSFVELMRRLFKHFPSLFI